MAPADPFTEELVEEQITIRGREFTVRELPYNEYRKLELNATKKITLADGSEAEGAIDRDLLDSLLISKAIVNAVPPVPSAGVFSLGTRVIIALRTVVNRVHYGAVGQTALQTEQEAETKKDDGKGKG